MKDITTYTIIKTEPVMEFEDLCLGIGKTFDSRMFHTAEECIGGKCGSTYIDRNFNDWMTKTFKNAYTSVPEKERAPGSKFMDCFESCKRKFGASSGQSFEIYPIRMSTLSPKYDEDEGTVTLS